MKNINKNYIKSLITFKSISLVILAIILATISIIMLNLSNRIYWEYDDTWIIGRSKKEIVARYGDFEYKDCKEICYYFIGTNDRYFGYSSISEYYSIVFDENDNAVNIYIHWVT